MQLVAVVVVVVAFGAVVVVAVAIAPFAPGKVFQAAIGANLGAIAADEVSFGCGGCER